MAPQSLTERRLVEAVARDLLPAYHRKFASSLTEWIKRGLELTPAQLRAANELLDNLGAKPTPQCQATVAGDRIVVRSPFALKDLIKAIPSSRWDGARKAWTYPATATSARNIADALEAQGGVEHDDGFAALLGTAEAHQRQQAVKHVEDLPDIGGKLPAWQHQRQAFHFAKDLPAACLAMAMGTGKSLSAIRIIEVNDAKRVLVLCPSSVVGVWPREFAKHAIEDWTVVDLRSGAVAKRTERAEAELRAASLDERVAVVINYEAAWREPFASFALKQRWDYVVLDEVHRIKSNTGRASKFCWQLGKTAKRRLGLTGTPIPHTILDVFGQYRALDPDVFGTSYTAFKNRYGEWGGFNNYQLTGIKNEDDFNRRFYSIAFRVGSDVLDLPGEHDIDRTCELSPKAKRLYLDLRDEMYGEQDGEPITASNALTRLLRLQQLTGGAVNDDEGGFHEIDDSKAQLLTDVLEDLDAADPVVVFCRFTHDLAAVRRVTEKLGRRYGEVSGQRKDLTADATMPADVDVLGVQIQAGGLGIDLTRSHVGVYYSLGFSLADYLQSRARLARPGQDDKVLFIHLIAEGTVDEDVYGALSKRQEVVDYILSGLEQSK